MCQTHRGKAMQGPAAVWEPGTGASPGTNPHDSLILGFVASELWENTFLLFSHRVCGSLSWQPQQTNAVPQLPIRFIPNAHTVMPLLPANDTTTVKRFFYSEINFVLKSICYQRHMVKSLGVSHVDQFLPMQSCHPLNTS